MPPPDLPYHRDDIDLGFGRRRRDWGTAIKYAAPAVVGAGAYAAGKAKQYFWPPAPPTIPYMAPKQDDSLFLPENMGGKSKFRGGSAVVLRILLLRNWLVV